MDKNTRELLILAALTIVLVAIVLGAILVQPLILLGLPPVLFGIAALIRAIRGDTKEQNKTEDTSVSPALRDAAKTAIEPGAPPNGESASEAEPTA